MVSTDIIGSACSLYFPQSGEHVWSSAFYQCLELSPKHAPDLDLLYGLIHQDDLALFKHSYETFTVTDTSQKMSYRIRTKGDVYRWVSSLFQVLTTSEGQTIIVNQMYDSQLLKSGIDQWQAMYKDLFLKNLDVDSASIGYKTVAKVVTKDRSLESGNFH